MGRKAPDRYEIMDREFPVRLTVRSDPETHELTWRWLQQQVGTGNYASKAHIMWSAQRTQCVYFRSIHDAMMFIAGCPHVQVYSERYTGPRR